MAVKRSQPVWGKSAYPNFSRTHNPSRCYADSEPFISDCRVSQWLQNIFKNPM